MFGGGSGGGGDGGGDGGEGGDSDAASASIISSFISILYFICRYKFSCVTFSSFCLLETIYS